MDFLQPLMIGILGSFHCMGMCGAIALSLPLNQDSRTTRIIGEGLYNLGRVMTYILLGLIFGLFGLGIHIWGFQQWVSIISGTIMVLSVGFPMLFARIGLTNKFESFFSGFKRLFGRFFGIRTWLSIWMIGLLNGFLPCGLVYIALAGALVSTGPANGALYMLLFGLGTVPALIVVGFLGNIISVAFRRKLQRAVPFLVILIGILFILRGMDLGIPYVSPKMDRQVQNSGQLQKPACCH